MQGWQRIATALIVVNAFLIPSRAATQAAIPPPAAAASAQLRHGEAWFYQRCALCHMGRIVKDDTYKSMGPSLTGVLKNKTPEQQQKVLDQIQHGSQRMPGFRNNFTATEFDELVAYLKTL